MGIKFSKSEPPAVDQTPAEVVDPEKVKKMNRMSSQPISTDSEVETTSVKPDDQPVDADFMFSDENESLFKTQNKRTITTAIASKKIMEMF